MIEQSLSQPDVPRRFYLVTGAIYGTIATLWAVGCHVLLGTSPASLGMAGLGGALIGTFDRAHPAVGAAAGRVKNKSRRCSTGHGTGVLQAAPLARLLRPWPRLVAGHTAGRLPRGMRDEQGRTIAADKRALRKKAVPKIDLGSLWLGLVKRIWKPARTA